MGMTGTEEEFSVEIGEGEFGREQEQVSWEWMLWAWDKVGEDLISKVLRGDVVANFWEEIWVRNDEDSVSGIRGELSLRVGNCRGGFDGILGDCEPDWFLRGLISVSKREVNDSIGVDSEGISPGAVPSESWLWGEGKGEEIGDWSGKKEGGRGGGGGGGGGGGIDGGREGCAFGEDRGGGGIDGGDGDGLVCGGIAEVTGGVVRVEVDTPGRDGDNDELGDAWVTAR
jgi:hypothetical protein